MNVDAKNGHIVICYHEHQENISTRISRNSEAQASEFLANLEEKRVIYFADSNLHLHPTHCENILYILYINCILTVH